MAGQAPCDQFGDKAVVATIAHRTTASCGSTRRVTGKGDALPLDAYPGHAEVLAGSASIGIPLGLLGARCDSSEG